jgi:transcriptional regulator with XRE-family HTH domain
LLHNIRRMNIGAAFRKLREQKGLTQVELAKKAKTTQARISRIEQSAQPTKESIDLLCSYYGIPSSMVLAVALEESDVPKRNKKLYGKLKPVIDDMVSQLLDPKFPK